MAIASAGVLSAWQSGYRGHFLARTLQVSIEDVRRLHARDLLQGKGVERVARTALSAERGHRSNLGGSPRAREFPPAITGLRPRGLRAVRHD